MINIGNTDLPSIIFVNRENLTLSRLFRISKEEKDGKIHISRNRPDFSTPENPYLSDIYKEKEKYDLVIFTTNPYTYESVKVETEYRIIKFEPTYFESTIKPIEFDNFNQFRFLEKMEMIAEIGLTSSSTELLANLEIKRREIKLKRLLD